MRAIENILNEIATEAAEMGEPRETIKFRDRSDPEANGRQPQPGEQRYTVFFPLEDGRRLEIHMGREGIKHLRKVIMDEFMDEQFEINGLSSEQVA